MSTTRHKASAQASAPLADDLRRLPKVAKAAKTCLTGLCAAWIVLLTAFAASPVVVAQSLPNAVPAFAAERASITTTLTSSANPVVVGGSSVLTATVSRGNPNASVTFMKGATPLGTVSVSGNGNTRTASFTASFTTAGVQSLTAVYQANSGNASSTSAALAQTVNQASSSTALSATPNPSTVGQAITLTASVGGYNPSGSVTFKDGATTLGTGTLSAGVASFATSTLATGSHNITAVYGGDANNLGSTSSAVAQIVNQASSSTSLSATPNPATVGQGITLSATVSGYNPTGTVTFKDGASTLGTGTLSAGVASFTSSTLSAGNHSITAVYAGDTNNLSSTSGAVTQVVSQAATTTALASSANPATLGQTVTLTATVAGYNPGGSVTFKDGTTTLGTGTLTAGVASFATSALGVGSHALSADYAGDANNAPSSSSAVSVSITAATAGPMTWQYGYDAMGRPTTVLDPNGLSTYTYYDSLGRPIQTQQPPNTGTATPTTTSFAYNARDDLTKVTDPRSLETTYTPNGLGEVTAQTSPDTGASQYSYDANGNVLSKTDARGKQTQYAWDKLNRLTTVTYPTGSPTVLEYDGGTTPTPAATGELTKITDSSGQTSYNYDSLGRKTSKTVVINGKSFTVGYSWGNSGSALDKLTAISYPSGSRVNYGYDAQGAVATISVNPVNTNGVGANLGATLPLLSGITQNAESKLTGWSWASSKAQAISYDSNGQISAYNLGDQNGTGASAGVRRTVLRDSAGRIVAYTHANNGGPVPALDQSFSYDNLNRLVSASLGSTAIQYSYDATGNRTAKAISGTSYPNTIQSTSNKLTQTQDVLGTATVQHDAAGNITGDGLNTYTYSDRGRLASMSNTGGTASYSYNALELRVGKTGPTALIPTGAAYYIYDEAGKLLGEYDASGTPIYETIYLGMPVGVMKQSGTAGANNIAVSLYNVSTDQLGAPRIITRQSDEAIVWRWDMAEAFGATAPDQNPNNLGVFTYNQRLPGQVVDAESGLFQNWNREYNARLGRYMQSDPIGLEGGINTFGYVGGNPLSFVDLDGLAKQDPKEIGKPVPVQPGGGRRSPGGASQGSLIQPIVPGGGGHNRGIAPQCPPEVKNTLDRIKAGEGYPHRNDGSVFQNKEKLLPMRPDGYYREWVHPTSGVQGPGAQRVVTGEGGEAYYTPDHYRTFIPVP